MKAFNRVQLEPAKARRFTEQQKKGVVEPFENDELRRQRE